MAQRVFPVVTRRHCFLLAVLVLLWQITSPPLKTTPWYLLDQSRPIARTRLPGPPRCTPWPMPLGYRSVFDKGKQCTIAGQSWYKFNSPVSHGFSIAVQSWYKFNSAVSHGFSLVFLGISRPFLRPPCLLPQKWCAQQVTHLGSTLAPTPRRASSTGIGFAFTYQNLWETLRIFSRSSSLFACYFPERSLLAIKALKTHVRIDHRNPNYIYLLCGTNFCTIVVVVVVLGFRLYNSLKPLKSI
jgi:hypothetical protein